MSALACRGQRSPADGDTGPMSTSVRGRRPDEDPDTLADELVDPTGAAMAAALPAAAPALGALAELLDAAQARRDEQALEDFDEPFPRRRRRRHRRRGVRLC